MIFELKYHWGNL